MVLSRGFLSHNAQMHGLRYGCTIMQRFSTHNSIAATVRVRVDISGKQVNYKVKWDINIFGEWTDLDAGTGRLIFWDRYGG